MDESVPVPVFDRDIEPVKELVREESVLVDESVPVPVFDEV